MNPAGRAFATITAALEDMHGIAVEGQHPDLSRDECRVLISGLRSGMIRLDRLVVRAVHATDRAK